MKPDLSRWSIARLLLLGLVIREAFSFWTGHPFDMEIWVRNGYYVSLGGSPYAPMPPVPGLSFTYLNQSIASVAYLPLWPLMLAGLYRLFSAVSGSRFVLYFLLKQPSILGDVLLGYLMGRAAERWGAPVPTARRVLAFWMVFPYPILISAIWGMFDGLVAACVVGSLLVSATWKRSSLLGLGVLLKLYPVIFVPFAILHTRARARWEALLAVAVPAAFTAAAVAVTGWGLGGVTATFSWEIHVFPQGMTIPALLANPWVAPFFFANPGWVYFLGYVWVPGILVGSWWISRRFPGTSPQDLIQAFLFLTIVLFLLRLEVNEQYVVYLLPLLLLDVVLWHPERRALFRTTWVLTLAFVVLNNFLLVRFAIPAFGDALVFEDAWAANALFGGMRLVLLDVLAVLFSIHLIQMGRVIADPRKSPSPWLVVVPRRLWSASFARIRSRATERGG